VATPEAAQDPNRFVKSLSTAWWEGEVRPTHGKTAGGPRAWRTRVSVTFSVEAIRTGKTSQEGLAGVISTLLTT
jgi:hypothetical protein